MPSFKQDSLSGSDLVLNSLRFMFRIDKLTEYKVIRNLAYVLIARGARLDYGSIIEALKLKKVLYNGGR